MIVELNGRKYYALKQVKGGYEINGDSPLKGWTSLGHVEKTKKGKWKVKGMKGEWDTMKDAVQYLVVNQPMTGPLFSK